MVSMLKLNSGRLPGSAHLIPQMPSIANMSKKKDARVQLSVYDSRANITPKLSIC